MKNSEKISILIAVDHILVRGVWSRIFNDSPGFEVIGQCASGEEAIETSQKLNPQLLLLDVNLPAVHTNECTKKILKNSPGIKIIVISIHAQPEYAYKMIRSGASGFITKNSSVDEMFLAINTAINGEKYICNEVKDLLSENMISGDEEATVLSTLSKKEIKIINLILKGNSSREIAANLFIAVKTVERHRYNIFKKIKVKNVAALVNLVNKYQHIYQLVGN